jgi:hypothetical protein
MAGRGRISLFRVISKLLETVVTNWVLLDSVNSEC